MPSRTPHTRAARLLALHLAVVAAGAWAGAPLGLLLLPLTLADCALIAWTAAAPGPRDQPQGTWAGEQR